MPAGILKGCFNTEWADSLSFSKDFAKIKDWTEGTSVWAYLPKMLTTIDKIALSILDKQEPILMQPIWKTQGKSPTLSENCLDVFVWSNFAFTQLFLDVARKELRSRYDHFQSTQS